MPPEAINPEVASRLALFVSVMLVAGLASGIWWLRRWATLGQVITHQPRSNPPWLFGAVAIGGTVALLNVLNALSSRPPAADGGDTISNPEFISSTLLMTGALVTLAAAIVIALRVGLRATPHDLGWPTSWRQFLSDCGLGVLIAFASLVPVYVLQAGAIQLFDMPAKHPLLDRMQTTPDPWVFAAVLVSAVVAAPLFEEVLFRLLLQGGLEHWENKLAARRAQREALTEAFIHDGIIRDIEAELNVEEAEPDEWQFTAVDPASVPGLRHGWAPILVSSFLFAVAHLGNGPSPLPLFVLALFLGYAYQRTHRIVPSIVAHGVFNSLSVITLMLSIPPQAHGC